MSKTTLFLTDYTLTMPGVFEKAPVYRTQNSEAWVAVESPDYGGRKVAYPLLVGGNPLELGVDHGRKHLGEVENDRCSDGVSLGTRHTHHDVEYSPLTWKEHDTDIPPMVFFKKLEVMIVKLQIRIKVLEEDAERQRMITTAHIPVPEEVSEE